MARKITKTEKGALGFFGVVVAFLGIRRLIKGEEPPPPPPDKATLYGKVTDAETGKAIQGIEVGCNGYAAVTHSDGRYLIEDIIPGEYAVTFCDPQGQYESLEV